LRVAANGMGNVCAANPNVLQQPIIQGKQLALGPAGPFPMSEFNEHAVQDEF
jgi:hypothetical protein